MHHRIRRALSLLFLLSFLVIAPALIISTAGYRYNFIKGKVERTGVLFASSKPSGARIILNGGDTEKKTPNRVKRLLPGTYDVRLERDGYHPWSRTIDITSRETTFLNNIILFLKGSPQPLLDLPVDRAEFSPDRRYAAAITSTESHTELRVVDLRTGEDFLPYRTENVSGAELSISWSPDSSNFFVTRKSGGLPVIFVWNGNAPGEMTNLIEISPALYREAFWSQNGRFLHAVTERTLHSIDLRNRTAVENGPVADAMRIIDSTVFGVFSDGSGTKLVRRGLQDEAFEVLGSIPAGEYVQLEGVNDRIALHDARSSKLLVIDPNAQPGQLTYHELRAEETDWSKDGILLYRNGLELHVFDPYEARDILVTRLGGELGSARWYPEIGLIIYSNGRDALMTEASNDSRKNVTTIASFDELDGIALDAKGLRAWFTGRIGDREGLWTLKLR